MFIIPAGNVKEIMSELRDYIYEKGISIGEAKLNDTSPYAILGGGSSLNFRTKSRNYSAEGILFCCTSEDYDLVKDVRNIVRFPHREKKRPHAVFVPENSIDDVIEQLKKNPLNKR